MNLEQIEQVIAQGPYAPDWNSLSNMQVPDWFTKAKFGIFIHWGLYSIPAFSSEWYSRNMYIKGSREWEHHRKTYGEHTNFGYKDFIPLFRAEKFDPNEWAKLFQEAGARYVFPVAEHHDGFQMYRSELSKYNAFDMGPHRDILGELKQAFEREGLIFCTSSHRAEHYFFMSHGKEFDSDIHEPLKRGDFYWPAMPEPAHFDLYSKPYPDEEFLEDWLLRTCELIDSYQPSLLYFDWWILHDAFKPYLKKLLAYYYNCGVQWKRPTAVCYKNDSLMFGSGIVEIERGSFKDAKPYVWQTDTAIAKNSWGYTDSLEYKSTRDIVCQLIDIVSKNGNLLLNIGPKGDGSIPEQDKKILSEIGAWMKINGEGIYESHVWKKAQEGPTQTKEGTFTDSDSPAYTTNDFRFTAKQDAIYAFCMKCPKDGNFVLHTFRTASQNDIPEFCGIIKNVQLLGQQEATKWYVDEEGLHVQTLPIQTKLPVTLKITVK